MRWVAVPAPGRTLPSARAACSSARTTVVPIGDHPATAIPHASIKRAVDDGNVVRLVERQQPIELGVAGRGDACGVRERGKRAPRAREASRSRAQSRMNPADGASNATGWLAICVHVSQIASGSGT